MGFSDICSKLDKNYILIGTLFIFIIILLFLNYQKSNKIYAQQVRQSIKNEPFINNDSRNSNELVLYYTEWCGWSKKFLPEWNELESSNEIKNVTLRKVECEKNPDNKCKSIEGFPTIILYKSGKEIEFNSHPRTKDGVLAFLKENL